MKTTIVICWLMLLSASLCAQGTETIVLSPPDTNRGLPLMKALSLRVSATAYDTADLKIQDLSDLLWAANGVNRPASGKRTAPSAMNAQDIDVYVLMKSGAYCYNPQKHALNPVAGGDFRALCSGRRADYPMPPLICLMVSDISRFRAGSDSLKLVWSAMDAGIVSENISIFCASAGLATRPRAGMNHERLHEVLKLSETQYLMLNHPVSYAGKGPQKPPNSPRKSQSGSPDRRALQRGWQFTFPSGPKGGEFVIERLDEEIGPSICIRQITKGHGRGLADTCESIAIDSIVSMMRLLSVADATLNPATLELIVSPVVTYETHDFSKKSPGERISLVRTIMEKDHQSQSGHPR